MRASLLALLFLSGCYLSHQRVDIDPACDGRMTVTNVDVSRTVPILGEEVVGRFRVNLSGGMSEGIIMVEVALDGIFGYREPARLRAFTGRSAPETLLFESEIIGPGEVFPGMVFPLSSVVAGGGQLDIFMTVETAGLRTAMNMRVTVTSVLFGDPLDPSESCGDPVVGPTMTFVDACPTSPTGTFSFCPLDSGPGRGCCTTGSFPGRDFCGPLAAGDLVKGSLHPVYVIGRGGRRHVFPSDAELRSWLGDPDALGVPGHSIGASHLCSTVPEITDEELRTLVLSGRNVTIRPGTFVLQLSSVPDQYWLVSRGGVLRETSEGVGRAIYGPSFDRRISVVPDAFFVSYVIGTEVTSPGEYDAAAEAETSLLDDLDVPR
ncbi:hypothetical protein EPO33_03540 [Patescibacteria group bacterium]|nr:MAG: hypothetical protein EPO33_03540 [Patescibacteria group bacterium]